MKGLAIVTIVALPLLMGQMCGVPEAGSPQPLGLVPGLYAGQNSVSGVMKYFGEGAPQPDTASTLNNAFSLTVAESGLPCNTKGRELAVGVQDSATLGDKVMTLTVASISVNTSKVAVRYDVEFGDQSTARLTGVANQVLTQAGNTINRTTYITLAGTISPWTATFDAEGTATVNK